MQNNKKTAEESNDTLDLLTQSFKLHREKLERGDLGKIADASEETIHTVNQYITRLQGKSVVTGLKILKAMKELLETREEEVKRLTA